MSDTERSDQVLRVELAALAVSMGAPGIAVKVDTMLMGAGIGQRTTAITVWRERCADRVLDATARALWLEMAGCADGVVNYQLVIPAGHWQRVLRDSAAGLLETARKERQAAREAVHVCVPIPITDAPGHKHGPALQP